MIIELKEYCGIFPACCQEDLYLLKPFEIQLLQITAHVLSQLLTFLAQ